MPNLGYLWHLTLGKILHPGVWGDSEPFCEVPRVYSSLQCWLEIIVFIFILSHPYPGSGCDLVSFLLGKRSHCSSMYTSIDHKLYYILLKFWPKNLSWFIRMSISLSFCTQGLGETQNHCVRLLERRQPTCTLNFSWALRTGAKDPFQDIWATNNNTSSLWFTCHQGRPIPLYPPWGHYTGASCGISLKETH